MKVSSAAVPVLSILPEASLGLGSTQVCVCDLCSVLSGCTNSLVT